MIAKIAEGKLNAFFKETTMLSQAFVKDGSKSVADYLKSVDADFKVVFLRGWLWDNFSVNRYFIKSGGLIGLQLFSAKMTTFKKLSSFVSIQHLLCHSANRNCRC